MPNKISKGRVLQVLLNADRGFSPIFYDTDRNNFLELNLTEQLALTTENWQLKVDPGVVQLKSEISDPDRIDDEDVRKIQGFWFEIVNRDHFSMNECQLFYHNQKTTSLQNQEKIRETQKN